MLRFLAALLFLICPAVPSAIATQDANGGLNQPDQQPSFNRLAAIHDIQVGNLAPEIEGLDLDGVPFKLSDYQGQIVVLDFWGDW